MNIFTINDKIYLPKCLVVSGLRLRSPNIFGSHSSIVFWEGLGLYDANLSLQNPYMSCSSISF